MSIALLLAAASGNPQLAASDALCVDVKEVSVAVAHAEAAGWKKMIPEKGSPLGQLVGIYAAIKAPPVVTFQSPDTDKPLYLLARETIPAPVGIFVECTIYNFEAQAELPLDTLKQWQGRAPTYSFDIDGIAHGWDRGNGVFVSVSLEKPPCLSTNYCPAPRVTVERSILKSQ